MDGLLAEILEAHGGVDRWRRYERVEATHRKRRWLIRSQSRAQDQTPRGMTRAALGTLVGLPFGAPDQRTMFTPGRIAIDGLTGRWLPSATLPRDYFAGHQVSTPWVLLQRAISTARPCGLI